MSWITLLINTFLPLQGFFNAFIYARPRYLRLKKKNAHLGCMELVKLVFLPDEKKGPTSTIREKNSSSAVEDSSNSAATKRSGRDSNVYKSFLASLNRKKAAAAFPAVSVTEGDRDKTITWSDSKPMGGADEEKGKVEDGEIQNGDASPAEEEKVEEGEQSSDDFVESPSTPAASNT